MQSEKVPTRRNQSVYRSVTDIYVPPFQHNTNKIEGKIDPERGVGSIQPSNVRDQVSSDLMSCKSEPVVVLIISIVKHVFVFRPRL